MVDGAAKRFDAAGDLAAAEDLRAVAIPGGEIGQRAAAAVLVLDARRLVGRGAGGGGFAVAGLDGGLLIRGEDVVIKRRGRSTAARASNIR